jgi:hypothetical protein
MLLTPLRVAAALLAFTAGHMLLPELSQSAHAQDIVVDEVQDEGPAPAPIAIAEDAPAELQTGDDLDGSYATGDCQGGNCQGGYQGKAHGNNVMGNPISSRDLFYNYYVGPAAAPNPYGANAVAAMYPSPVPAPPLVGHTYITYQPLLPHEFLYAHTHYYYSEHPGGGQTTTRVRYRHSPWGAVNPIFGNRAPRPRGPEYLENPLWR